MNDAKASGSDVAESALPLGVAVIAGPSREPGGRLGMDLSGRELSALAAYGRLGSQAEAAAALRENLSTTKNLLSHAYAKLGVFGAINAFRALGWLRVPEEVA